MLLANIFSMVLRLAELAFAAIVAGITGNYLHSQQGVSAWDLGRFIYTEVVAGLSIIFAIIWLFPFSGSFIHWPADLFISIMWWVVFGLLVNVSASLFLHTLFPSSRLSVLMRLTLNSSSATRAATSSTGEASPSAGTHSARNSRPTSPSPSFRPSAGSSPPSSAFGGCVAARGPPSLQPIRPTLAAGASGTARVSRRISSQAGLSFPSFLAKGSCCVVSFCTS